MIPPHQPSHDPAPAANSVGRVVRDLVVEFDGDVGENVVLAYVARACAAVAFFGDHPGERAEWVADIARNELRLLSGRDTDRART
jgi:hypothetical protein